MKIHFVPTSPDSLPTRDAFIDYLLERRRYTKYAEDVIRYENPDTGVFFDVEMPSGEDAIRLAREGKMPFFLEYKSPIAAYGVEIADEVEAITERFLLHVASSGAVEERGPFVRARLLLQHADEVRTMMPAEAGSSSEASEEVGEPSRTRATKLDTWTIEHAYRYNAQLDVTRAWMYSERPGTDVPRVFCVEDPSKSGVTATAIEWDGRAALLPAVDWVIVTRGGERRAVPMTRMIEPLERVSRASSERFVVNDVTYEVELPHWLLDAEQRRELSAIAERSFPEGPSLKSIPWFRVMNAD